MAAEMQIVVQKQMIPFSKLNGLQSYRDYGFALAYFMDTTPIIPTVIKSGLVPSGPEMTIYQPTITQKTSVPENFSNITGELEPIIRDGAEYKGEEATGIIE